MAELEQLLTEIGFVEFKLVRKFDCFRETSKEEAARNLGVEAVNIFARKP